MSNYPDLRGYDAAAARREIERQRDEIRRLRQILDEAMATPIPPRP